MDPKTPIAPLDPFELVRRRPAMFAPADKSSLRAFAEAIAADAAVLGARDITIKEWKDWIAVCSSDDWIGEAAATIFKRLEPFPHRINDCRAESIAFAFATAMCLNRSGEGLVWAKPASPEKAPPGDLPTLPPTFLAFQLA